MANYGLLVTLYLFYLGIQGEWVGPLLWPAVALHAVLTLLLARAWFSARSAVTKQPVGRDTHREKTAR
jgi:uncharacterized membrane protein